MSSPGLGSYGATSVVIFGNEGYYQRYLIQLCDQLVRSSVCVVGRPQRCTVVLQNTVSSGTGELVEEHYGIRISIRVLFLTIINDRNAVKDVKGNKTRSNTHIPIGHEVKHHCIASNW